ncbi:MAG: hypothetical protein HEQ32_06845 [Vampirovibrio sp.]
MSSSLSLQPQASPSALYPSLPPSPELEKSDPTTAPEVKKALDRWYPEQDDWYGLFPQANQHKLSDFLAHPIKNISNVINVSATAFPVFGLSVNLIQIIRSKIKPELSTLPRGKNGIEKLLTRVFTRAALFNGVGVLFCGGLTVLDYLYQKNRNEDTLKGIQILGENATRDDWINYKKTHPEIKQA